MRPSRSSPYLLALIAITLVGLGLRLLAAQGALWLDEAWSAVFARDVATPLGILTAINHDNNHHLNTLWLQLVGFDAPPVLQRGLSIVCGTAAIPITAMLARSRMAAFATAALFACAPILVVYGSEARGYAPMLLVLLTLLIVIDRWLSDVTKPFPAIGVMALCVIGVLSQMTFVFALPAVFGWIAWRAGARALLRTAPLPAFAVIATLVAILWWLPSEAGFAFGAYTPFAARELIAGITDVTAFTFGLPRHPLMSVVPMVLLAMGSFRDRERWPFHLLAILGLPAVIALLHVGNAGIARYYLLSAVAILLLAGTITARRAVVLAALLVTMLVADIGLIRDRRADPGPAVAMILAGGGTVMLDRSRAAPVIESAAAARRRRIRIMDCARWLFVDRDGTEPFPARPIRCGHSYTLAAQASPTGISGTHWRLYRR